LSINRLCSGCDILKVSCLFGLSEGDPIEVVLAAAGKIRELLVELGHPQDFTRHNLAKTDLPTIIRAVAHDPLAAFYPIAPDRIEKVCRKVCGWE
jgi:alcohol dehydrogenase class IV